jgi:hypothetical protein
VLVGGGGQQQHGDRGWEQQQIEVFQRVADRAQHHDGIDHEKDRRRQRQQTEVDARGFDHLMGDGDAVRAEGETGQHHQRPFQGHAHLEKLEQAQRKRQGVEQRGDRGGQPGGHRSGGFAADA